MSKAEHGIGGWYLRMRGPLLRLEGEKCGCGELIFPPRDICPGCQQDMMRPSGDDQVELGERKAENESCQGGGS